MNAFGCTRGHVARLLAVLALSVVSGNAMGSAELAASVEEAAPAAPALPRDDSGVVSPIVRTPGPEQEGGRTPWSIRRRTVELDIDMLHGAAMNASERPVLTLPLFDDMTVPLEVREAAFHGEGSFTIQATIPRSLGGYAMISVHNEFVSGTVSVPSVGQFELRGGEGGLYEVLEVDVRRMPGCGAGTAHRIGGPAPPPAPREAQAGLPEPIVARVYVVYTKEAVDFFGGEDILQFYANLAIKGMNVALANSQTNVVMKISDMDLVSYQEQGSLEVDLSNLRATDIDVVGTNFTVHEKRSLHCADFVLMVLHYNPPIGCGLAYQMETPTPMFAHWAFSVVEAACLYWRQVGHEIGHNMGCAHDHFAGGVGSFPFSHGHKYPVPDAALTPEDPLYATIMAVAPYDVEIMYYSNPHVDYPDGYPTGVPYGFPQPADNVLTIDNNAPIFSTFGHVIGGAHCVGQVINVPNDYPTIQLAIDAAEIGDVIIVKPGVYFERIDMRGKRIHLRSTDPLDPDVVASTIIDGGGIGTVITCNSGELPNTIINGLTIRNGHALRGGGVHIRNSSPTIGYCRIENNQAMVRGGGIYVESGSPSITRCTFSENVSSAEGGGLYIVGSNALVFHSTFLSNAASIHGGGMYVSGGSPRIGTGAVTRFDNNTAGFAGGGLYTFQSNIEISDTEFTANSALYRGGGMYVSGGLPTLNGVMFQNNSANFLGGGLYSDASSVRIEGATFQGNTTQEHGGGMYAIGGAPVIIESTFFNNSAAPSGEGRGGGLYLRDSEMQMTDSTVVNNVAGITGGGLFVFVDEGQGEQNWILPALASSFFCNNLPNNIAGPWSGSGNDICPGDFDLTVCKPDHANHPCDFQSIQQAINMADPGTTILVYSGLYQEHIDFGGKPIHLRSETPTDPDVVAATIIDGQGSGRVIRCTSGEPPNTVIEGFTIRNGQALHGGGMFIQNASPTVRHNVFANNSAVSVGGGMAIFNSSSIVQRCMFINNTASNSGGGMYTENSSQLAVQDCTFENNTAGSGGGIANLASSPVLSDIDFDGNTADNWGGGMYNATSSAPVMFDMVFRNNSAGALGGGMYSSPNSNPFVGDSTFCENSPSHIHGPWVNLDGNTFPAACPLPNNSPFNPEPLSGPSGSIVRSFDGATQDGTSSCDPDGVDLFFTYTVTDGPITLNLDTCGSAGNTAIAVFDMFFSEVGCSATCGGSPCGDPAACLLLPGLDNGEYLIRVSQTPAAAASGSGPLVLSYASSPYTFGDLNGDGVVNVSDLLILFDSWGPCADCGNCIADLNGDCVVNVSDLLMLFDNWG
jgi:parallel beta-helix repeat protein